jgi:hypothetical protein
MQEPTASFERSLLCDPDVKFGATHYELLRTIRAFVQELKDAGAHVGADGSTTLPSSVINIAGLDEGPSLLTLIRLAHAGGNRLVISLEDANDPHEAVELLRI